MEPAAAGEDQVANWHQGRWRQRMRRHLLAWFDANARQLAWRQQPTPYRVWVSEMMLQQTQVATVVDYYHRFLEAFPDLERLAAADQSELLRLWEGLGYYRRAKAMQQAARQIVQQHGGQFPNSFEEVIALPGIGRYTAGAILSICHDQRLPVLEGNTVRVYSRWIALRQDVGSTAAQRTLWQVAEAMLPRRRCGRYNQAAMELGALVCRARDPQCDVCPVRDGCAAHALALQTEIPGKVKRLQYEPRLEFAFVVPVRGGRYLLIQAAEGGRWAGLWDFPRWTEGHCRRPEQAAAALSRCLGIDIRPAGQLTTIKHAVTRYRITLQVHAAQQIDRLPAGENAGRWRLVSADDFGALPLNATGRRIADLVSAAAGCSGAAGRTR